MVDNSSDEQQQFSETSSSQESVASSSSDGDFSDLESDTGNLSTEYNRDSDFDHHESDPDDDDFNPDDYDSDPDYDPSNETFPSHEKTPIPAHLLKEVSENRGSYRLCENLLKTGVKINGGNPNAYGISKTNLWSKIIQLRSSQKNRLLESLSADTCKIILHFDGKQCSRLNERHVGKEERFIILCHTIKGDIPLGFFALKSKSGAECANEILKWLTEYNLSNRVVGMVSDTESTNTGHQNGTCALVEHGLKDQLLYLMCRHHIKEVMLKDLFAIIFGRSQAANITTFNMLIENWDDIKATGFQYAPINNTKLIETPLLRRISQEAIESIKLHAKSKVIREDYAEINDLVLKFFGIKTDIPFRVVGARNNARWMARIIYAMKTYLFRNHLDLDFDFIDSLERFCLFVALIYTKHWNRCTNAVDAAFNDMKLMKELNEYEEIDDEIAHTALVAHKRHLWYLSDELIVLALFSNNVTNEVKRNMVVRMTRHVGQRTQNSIKYTAEIHDIANIELHDFISPRSFFLFERLQLDAAFLHENPGEWHTINAFKRAKQEILGLITVVNDNAERALQLGSNTITNQRVQTQRRLQDFIISTYGW